LEYRTWKYTLFPPFFKYHRSVRIKWILIGAALLVLLVGGGALLFRAYSPGARNPGSGNAAVPAAVFNGSEVILTGRIEALEVVAVPVPFAGTIDALPGEVGQDVYEGQLLAQIRSTGLESSKQTAKAALDRLRTRVDTLHSDLLAARTEAARAQEMALQAQTKMENALKEAQKQQNLLSKGAAGKLAAEKAQTQYEAARSYYDDLNKLALGAQQKVTDLATDLDGRQKTLEERIKADEDVSAQVASGDVMSPADGYIVARQGQVGGEVTKDSPDLFRIGINLGTLKLVAQAPTEILAKVKAGQPVVIQIAEIPQGLEATVTEVREGEVWIEFPRPSPLVKPGLTAVVRIKVI
jgi:multidrug efflux pump subunit AcrA (membrane-fusion protein)